VTFIEFEFVATCVLLLLASVVAFAILAGPQRFAFLLSPFGLFTAFFAFQYFVIPLMQFTQRVGRYTYFAPRGLTSASFAALGLCLLYFASAFTGFGYVGRRPDTAVLRESALAGHRAMDRVILKYLLIVFFVALLLNVQYILPLILQDYAEFLANRISLLSGYGYVTMPLIVSVPILVMLAVVVFRHRTEGVPVGRVLWLSAAVMVPSVAFNLLLGGRSSALLNLINLAFVWAILFMRRRNLRQILILGFFSIASLQAITLLGAARRAAIQGGFDSFSQEYQQTSKSSAHSLASELATSLGHAELLAYMLDHRSDWKPALGGTYAAAFVLPIPRGVWPGKPVGGGPYLRNIVDPGSYVVGRKNLSSLLTGAPLEAYMNFGTLGVVLVGLLHGAAMGLLARRARRMVGAAGMAIYVILLLGLSFEFVYGEFLGTVARVGTMLVPVLVARRFARPLLRRGTAPPPGSVVMPGPAHAHV